MSERIVMMYWDCPSCGRKHIEGLTHDCPSCGKQRDESTRFYLDNGPKKYVDHKVVGADWYCDYCNALNPATLDKCENCGSPKSGSTKDYFDFKNSDKNLKSDSKRDYLNEYTRDELHNFIEKDTKSDELEIKDIKYEEPDKDVNKIVEIFKNGSSISNIVSSDITKASLKCTLIAIPVILLIIFLVKYFSPRTYEFDVNEVKWTNTINIEELRTFREDDWSVPIGGRTAYTRQEIHHYDKEIDYYKDVQKSRQVQDGGHYETRTRTRQVQDGYDVSYSYRDNGDGTASEVEHRTPRYKTETYEEKEWVTDYRTEYYTEKEPVYKDVPVYKTKYYYDIDRWVYDRSITTEGTDKNPYWGDVTLDEKHRESGRDSSYYMSGIQKGKNLFGKYKESDNTYAISYEEFKEIKSGDVLKIILKGPSIDSWSYKEQAKIYDFKLKYVA